MAAIQKLLQNPDPNMNMEQVCILKKDLKMLKNLGNKAHKCLEERFGSTLKFFLRIVKK